MAFHKKKDFIFFTVYLTSVVLTLPLGATVNIDCNGKAFHCINSTHFKICVDLGEGVSKTVDEFLIPCPRNTVCKDNNNFECEYQLTTTLAPIWQSDVTNEHLELSTSRVTAETLEKNDVTTQIPEYNPNNYNSSLTTIELNSTVIPTDIANLNSPTTRDEMLNQVNISSANNVQVINESGISDGAVFYTQALSFDSVTNTNELATTSDQVTLNDILNATSYNNIAYSSDDLSLPTSIPIAAAVTELNIDLIEALNSTNLFISNNNETIYTNNADSLPTLVTHISNLSSPNEILVNSIPYSTETTSITSDTNNLDTPVSALSNSNVENGTNNSLTDLLSSIVSITTQSSHIEQFTNSNGGDSSTITLDSNYLSTDGIEPFVYNNTHLNFTTDRSTGNNLSKPSTDIFYSTFNTDFSTINKSSSSFNELFSTTPFKEIAENTNDNFVTESSTVQYKVDSLTTPTIKHIYIQRTENILSNPEVTTDSYLLNLNQNNNLTDMDISPIPDEQLINTENKYSVTNMLNTSELNTTTQIFDLQPEALFNVKSNTSATDISKSDFSNLTEIDLKIDILVNNNDASLSNFSDIIISELINGSSVNLNQMNATHETIYVEDVVNVSTDNNLFLNENNAYIENNITYNNLQKEFTNNTSTVENSTDVLLDLYPNLGPELNPNLILNTNAPLVIPQSLRINVGGSESKTPTQNMFLSEYYKLTTNVYSEIENINKQSALDLNVELNEATTKPNIYNNVKTTTFDQRNIDYVDSFLRLKENEAVSSKDIKDTYYNQDAAIYKEAPLNKFPGFGYENKTVENIMNAQESGIIVNASKHMLYGHLKTNTKEFVEASTETVTIHPITVQPLERGYQENIIEIEPNVLERNITNSSNVLYTNGNSVRISTKPAVLGSTVNQTVLQNYLNTTEINKVYQILNLESNRTNTNKNNRLIIDVGSETFLSTLKQDMNITKSYENPVEEINTKANELITTTEPAIVDGKTNILPISYEEPKKIYISVTQNNSGITYGPYVYQKENVTKATLSRSKDNQTHFVHKDVTNSKLIKHDEKANINLLPISLHTFENMSIQDFNASNSAGILEPDATLRSLSFTEGQITTYMKNSTLSFKESLKDTSADYSTNFKNIVQNNTPSIIFEKNKIIKNHTQDTIIMNNNNIILNDASSVKNETGPSNNYYATRQIDNIIKSNLTDSGVVRTPKDPLIFDIFSTSFGLSHKFIPLINDTVPENNEHEKKINDTVTLGNNNDRALFFKQDVIKNNETLINLLKKDTNRNLASSMSNENGLKNNFSRVEYFHVDTINESILKTTVKNPLAELVDQISHSDNQMKSLEAQFTCVDRRRGRYSDKSDCSKFYICIGKLRPIIGMCPMKTVFSEIKKQCTKNLSHCIRNNQFRCLSAGRFIDVLSEGFYYICVDKNDGYVRYKMQCQNGYHLNKANIQCSAGTTSIEKDSKTNSENSTNETKSKGVAKTPNYELQFDCEQEGKFEHPSDCNKYFVCKKKSKSKFRRKIKKCESEEVFHKEKKKCVDADSYEC